MTLSFSLAALTVRELAPPALIDVAAAWVSKREGPIVGTRKTVTRSRTSAWALSVLIFGERIEIDELRIVLSGSLLTPVLP